jgi:hypothetical protein
MCADAHLAVVASDKLFFWLFQEHTDRLLPLVSSLVDNLEGYSFMAPVIKEREVRPDGLFLQPVEQLQEKPALIMEAQTAANPEFFLRLYNGSSLLLMHQHRQGQTMRYWRVLVFCPSKELNFGVPVPVAEFLRERVIWIELAPERMPPRPTTPESPGPAAVARGAASRQRRRDSPAGQHCSPGQRTR